MLGLVISLPAIMSPTKRPSLVGVLNMRGIIC